MNDQISVTGATGVLGKAIVEALVGAGLRVRQAVRNLAKAKPNIDAVRLDYADASTIAPSLTGVSRLVLMAPPLDASAPALLGPIITAARDADIQQIVLISAFGVNHNEHAPLRVVEHLVIDSGVPFTIVRPNFLMENFSEGFVAPTIREQQAIFLAAADGKTSFVSARDVATVVVAALRQSLTSKEIDLTGSAALDHGEIAKAISDASRRAVVYHPLTEEQMLEGARSHGMPEPSVAYLGALYAVVRAGLAAPVTADFEAISGRKPTTFDAFARAAFEASR